MASNAEKDWQKWGDENPYFGVISDPRLLNRNLNEGALEEFFASGERHVDHVCRVIAFHSGPNARMNRVLDFGCGVGRLVVPFAKRFETAVGVDVSDGMLARARENCVKYAVNSARLIHADEMKSLEAGSFDLVHSFIVFQHIPVARGEQLLRELIALLVEGGAGAIQFVYSDKRSAPHRAVLWLRSRSGLVHGLFNLMQGRKFSWPLMQMNGYSMNRVFDILLELRCSILHIEFSDHGGFHGAMIYFQKQAGSLPHPPG